MRIKYLLPCSCGREIPIEATQAGEEVVCACGAKLEVPTLLKLNTLKRVGIPAESPKRRPARAAWGVRQQLILIGILIAAAGAAWAVWLYVTAPPRIDVSSLSPLRSMFLWYDLKRGVQFQPPAEAEYLKRIKEHHLWLLAAWSVAAAGIVVACSPLLITGQTKPPKSAPTSTARPAPGPGGRRPGPGSRRQPGPGRDRRRDPG